MLRNVYALKVGSNKSDAIGFTVIPVLPTSGLVKGIRVQDVERQVWFIWDDPPRDWEIPPSCAPGVNNLYVSFWVCNLGQDGDLTLKLQDDTGAILATKTVWVPNWGGDKTVGAGIEWTGTMPPRNYGLTCIVTP